MERKIGEVFQLGGEWYQCIIGHCNQCSFDEAGTCKFIGNPHCAYRNDKKLVCFKKLEKVGEPYSDYLLSCGVVFFQKYKFYCTPIIEEDIYHRTHREVIDIEIKQDKEYMEEKKLRPFNLEEAKQGKPVCTRDGRKARIICFDFRDVEEICCLIAAVDYGEAEKIYYYDSCGKYRGGDSSKYDLMMLPEKKVGWINIYKGNKLDADCIYPTLENALENILQPMLDNYIDTIKLTWEE